MLDKIKSSDKIKEALYYKMNKVIDEVTGLLGSDSGGTDNVSATQDSHTEGARNLASNGTAYPFTSYDPSTKTITLAVIGAPVGLAIGDFVDVKISEKLSLTQVKVTNIVGSKVTLDVPDGTIDVTRIIKRNSVQKPTHAEGDNNLATGNSSHAEGYSTKATGQYSHAEGYKAIADADYTHAEGGNTRALASYTHAEGYGTMANGQSSHAEGNGTSSYGTNSHAEGYNTNATGNASHAEGYNTNSNSEYSHAEGSGSVSRGTCSHAEGYNTTASGGYSHAEGSSCEASGTSAHAEGASTKATGYNSHTEGGATEASSSYAHAEGYACVASGQSSHAEGQTTIAKSAYSHAEGFQSTSNSYYSHSEGLRTLACSTSNTPTIYTISSVNTDTKELTLTESHSLTVGNLVCIKRTSNTAIVETRVTGVTSNSITVDTTESLTDCKYVIKLDTTTYTFPCHSEGDNTIAIGSGSHAEGTSTLATNSSSHAEGYGTIANGQSSHAEGSYTVATGASSHAEGYSNTSSGIYSHSEGTHNVSSGAYAHSEGTFATASGFCSHVEGSDCISSGDNSHAEGSFSESKGYISHAEGIYTVASGFCSHSAGSYTQARYLQYVIGQYNTISTASDTDYSATNEAFIVGNGTRTSARGNAFKVLFSGATYADGAYASTGADYAEYFEWLDGNVDNEDRVGIFVTTEGDKIVKATAEDDYILGIVSATPSVVGDNYESWKDKYVTDDFGRIQYHEVMMPAEYATIHYDEVYGTSETTEGEVTRVLISEAYDEKKEVSPERTEMQPIYNPDWNKEEEYSSRENRKEWSAIGMMGKLLVKDDGTCLVNGYCKPTNEGIATKCDKLADVSFRVIKRINDHIIQVILK